MMMQINQAGKWLIWAFIILLGGSFIAMDLMGLKQDKIPPVAVVNGKEISLEYFDRQLESYLTQAGNLEDSQKSIIRRKMLDEMIQRELLQGYISQMGLYASGAEMLFDLQSNPPEGVKQSPAFMTDSVFDMRKYQAWLKEGKTYDIPQMKQYEALLREERIPMMQLQTLIGAAFRSTDLEAEFIVAQRETKVKLDVAFASADSFKVAPSQVTEAEIKAYFEAQKDSFWVKDDMAKFVLLSTPIVASLRDDSIAKSVANDVLKQIQEGQDFAEVAKLNSEDKASAEKGGALGGFQPLTSWDTAFATAARTLDSGKISGLVRTSFGYHIIRSNGKKVEDGVEKMDLSHILIEVNPGTETLDSLKNVMTEAHKLITDEGKTAAEAKAALAKKANISIDSTGWLQRSENIQKLGYLRGLSSFGFSKAKTTLRTSEVLENDKFIAIALKAGYEVGGKRSLERYQAQIVDHLVQQKKIALAQAALKNALPSIQAGTPVAGISLDTTSLISLDGFVPKLGFSSVVMPKVAKQPLGSWGNVLESEHGAVAVKLKEKTVPDASQLSQLAKQEVAATSRFLTPLVFKDWIQGMKTGKGVVDNLELHYIE